MRTLVLAVMIAATLAGCASVRKGLGEYQKAADKGVNIGGPPTAGPVDAVEGGSGPAASSQPGKPGKHSDLPSGLGGDKANAQYTSVPQG